MSREFILSIILYLFQFFSPIQELLLAVIFLLIIDAILDVLAAIKLKVFIVAQSIRSLIVKNLLYHTALMSSFLVSHFMMKDSFPIPHIIASIIGLIELKSILQNLGKMSGEPVFKRVIRMIRKKEKEIEAPKQ